MKNSFMLKNKCVFTIVGLALLVALSGCKSKPKNLNDGVLGSRNLLPPPYVQPFEPVAEPLPPAPVIPAGMQDDTGIEPLPLAGPTFVPSDSPVFVPTSDSPTPEQALVPPPPPTTTKRSAQPVIQAPADKPATRTLRTHTVQAGETMGSIAACVGVRWQDIAAVNQNVDPRRMQIGTQLNLPSTASNAPIVAPKLKPKTQSKGTSNAKASTASSSKGTTSQVIPADGIYVVEPNDSVWKIARRFKVAEKDIRAWNNLTGENPKLQVGQKLQLRTGAASTNVAPSASAAVTPTVEKPTEVTEFGPLESMNNLDVTDTTQNTQIEVVVPENESTTPMQETSITHTVQTGETLESIALFYEIAMTDLLRANPNVKTNADLATNTVLRIQYYKK